MRPTLSKAVSTAVSSAFSPSVSSSSAQATLLIPGLIWPHQALLDLSHDLPTRSFCGLLGAGKLSRLPAGNTTQVFASAVGFPAGYAAAPIRFKEMGGDAGDHHWLCLDPINLGFAESRLLVNDPSNLAISALEAEQFAVALAPTFAAFGEMFVTAPGAWHLRLNATPPEALTLVQSLRDSIGQRADSRFDPGGLPADWRHALNEAQMLLHAHPLNQAREANGLPTVNSLWPWGAGQLTQAANSAHDLVLSNDLALRGLAQQGGATVDKLPAEWLPGHAKHTLVHLDLLDDAARRHDGLAWREALSKLERHWFAPLRESLKHGKLNRLVLEFPGETQSFRLELGRIHLWRFWRKARPLTCLADA
jgi:hypothetical protein